MTLRKFVDAGVLLAIGFLVGMMVADVSSVEHFASEWQTLIAGILAVIAAAWTVREMRRNDGAQQVRHEQLMQLNLRADRLRARRAAFPYGLQLATVGEKVQTYDPDGFDDMPIQLKREAVGILMQCREQLQKLLVEPSVVEAKDMFGSDMSHTYKLLLGHVAKFGNQPVLMDIFWRRGSQDDVNLEEIERYYREVAVCGFSVTQFSSQLLALAGHYGPD